MPYRRTIIALAFAALTATATIPAFAQTETILHQFVPFAQGYFPKSNLVADSQGNFYGTTSSGGAYGFGTVYRLSPSAKGGWTQTVLHSFQENSVDGIEPIGNIVIDSAGNIYGVTAEGGQIGDAGVAYEMSPSSGTWTETILHYFNYQSEGAPVAGLVSDAAGNLYGPTYGTVFELSYSSAGWSESTVHAFSGRLPDCAVPGAVSIDAAGNLYGYALYPLEPGFGFGCSVVFELTPSPTGHWNFITVHDFVGKYPFSNLAIDAQGNIFGAYQSTLFELLKVADASWIAIPGEHPILIARLEREISGVVPNLCHSRSAAPGNLLFSPSKAKLNAFCRPVLYTSARSVSPPPINAPARFKQAQISRR